MLNPSLNVRALTSLRFFLATWVVLYHWAVVHPVSALSEPSFGIIFNITHTGYVAVGIFFLLSGFVLALNYPLDRPWSTILFKNFALARFSRLYPVYFLGTVCVAPLVLAPAFQSPAGHLALRRSLSGLLSVSLLQAWVPPAALSWNGPAWSVSTEAFFYLCFPVVGRWAFSVRSVRLAMLAIGALSAVQLIVPLLCVVLHVNGLGDVTGTGNAVPSFVHNLTCFNPVLNLPSFLIGILCCRIYRELMTRGSFLVGRGYVLYVPAILFFCLTIQLASHIRFPMMHNGLLTLPGAGLVLGLALGDNYLSKLLSMNILDFLGKASYAEYMLHFPIRAAFESFVKQSGTAGELTYIVLVVAVSSVVYVAYEEPMRRCLRSRLSPTEIRQRSKEPIHKLGLHMGDVSAATEQA